MVEVIGEGKEMQRRGRFHGGGRSDQEGGGGSAIGGGWVQPWRCAQRWPDEGGGVCGGGVVGAAVCSKGDGQGLRRLGFAGGGKGEEEEEKIKIKIDKDLGLD